MVIFFSCSVCMLSTQYAQSIEYNINMMSIINSVLSNIKSRKIKWELKG